MVRREGDPAGLAAGRQVAVVGPDDFFFVARSLALSHSHSNNFSYGQKKKGERHSLASARLVRTLFLSLDALGCDTSI